MSLLQLFIFISGCDVSGLEFYGEYSLSVMLKGGDMGEYFFTCAFQEAQNWQCFFGWISIRLFQADGLWKLLLSGINRVSKKRRPIFLLPEPLALKIIRGENCDGFHLVSLPGYF
ncbi:hypothetical protein [Chitinophaga sp. S165]|uniref:hypothetical protein n=1 Tax=Chitinophaga sp. S165 TaxID=2135462 RepID=UPI0011B608A8|nr:hypothetical protein [Chitinophaga sp. S165]